MARSIDDLIEPGRRLPARREEPAPAQPGERAHHPLRLTVSWGDFTQVPGDIHVTGHYQGVMPAAAEAALDRAVSPRHGRRVISEHTRRRWLVGSLGEVAFFPGGDGTPIKQAAVIGLGRVGTFSRSSAVVLYESLLGQLLDLGSVGSVVTVPIGAGAGNLSAEQVAEALVQGFSAALDLTDRDGRPLPQVTVVEIDRLTAERLHRAMVRTAEGVDVLAVDEELADGPDGHLGADAAAVLALRALLERLRTEPDAEQAARDVLARQPEHLHEALRAGLRELCSYPGVVAGVDLHDLGRRSAEDDRPGLPTRLSVRHSARGLSWSALTARATVPEREVSLNERIVGDLATRLTAPDGQDAVQLPHLMTQWLLPEDLRGHLCGDAALVIEVDRYSARLPWEFLHAADADPDDDGCEPLAVRQCLARQMRTTYARTDLDTASTHEHRALVIGDPGGPEPGMGLGAARAEAVEVADRLRASGIQVDALIGDGGTPPPEGAKPAVLLDALARLLTGRYDIVHFSGHGSFVPDRPELSGWVFADGTLTARELLQLRRAPWLVMANACWSAAVPAPVQDGSEVDGGTAPAAAPPAPAAATTQPRAGWGRLAPVMADEFLRVGVGHFVGTSWRIPDNAARVFASTFYGLLLGTDGTHPVAAGEALRRARSRLYREVRPGADVPEVATAWAAYQHYGEPGDMFPRRRVPERSAPG